MIALSPTDGKWFTFLRSHPEIGLVNFWTPTDWNIQSLSRGDYWYFILKGSLPRKIGGCGRFLDYKTMSASEAWSKYKLGNGAASYTDMLERLKGFIVKRALSTTPVKDPIIGCVLLDNCVFLPDSQQKTPDDFGLPFPAEVVKYKTFNHAPLELSLDSSVTKEIEEATDQIIKLGEFSPKSTEDARKRVIASIVRRRGQPAFRNSLITAYGGCCAVTACDALDSLEAAHIVPYQGSETNKVNNGLLLRADIHTLFDVGLLTIDQNDFRIILHSKLHNGYYASLHGQKLNLPEEPKYWPNREALAMHRFNSKKCGV